MRREHYLLVNGYSTNYWGWGGEDDDMHARIVKKNLKLERPPASIARYKMLKHTHQKLNPSRMKVLRTAHIRIDSDGVNNVKYKLLNTTLYPLFTHFLIDVGEQSAWIDNSLRVLGENSLSSTSSFANSFYCYFPRRKFHVRYIFQIHRKCCLLWP